MKSESYQLGLLVGEIIYIKYLPTLEVDMLKTSNVIKITEEDLCENNRLEKILESTYKLNGGDGNSTEAHKNWVEHVNMLAKKYLPEKLKCNVEQIQPSNMGEFKNGLRDYLWNTDLSWYMPNDDFFAPNHEYAWCSTITLTLKIGN